MTPTQVDYVITKSITRQLMTFDTISNMNDIQLFIIINQSDTPIFPNTKLVGIQDMYVGLFVDFGLVFVYFPKGGLQKKIFRVQKKHLFYTNVP